MAEEHWSQEFEHSSITADNREAFNTHMSKFPTQGDAVANHMELAKMTGKPFKLPESMDKLPDDTSRSDFTSQAHKLLGIIKTKDINTLKDVNLKDGMAEGASYDEDFANSFKQFVVDNDLNVSDMPKYSRFFNTAMGKATVDMAAKTEADNLAAAEKCDAALIAHPSIGSKEKLLELSELFTRAMKKHVGLTAEEVEELGDALAISKLTKNEVLTRVMLHQFAPLAAEATSEGGGGGNKPELPADPDEGSVTYIALGWSKAK